MISFDCKAIMLEKLVFWYDYLHDFYLYKMYVKDRIWSRFLFPANYITSQD